MSSSSRLPDTAVAQACELLTSWTGIALRGTAPRRVAEFLSTRARGLGYDSKDSYVSHLLTLSSTDDESQRLINLVTNGLTCFWRDMPQLNALKTVFKDMAARRGDDEPIEVWCAGCSTGEEAYTVAMIGDQLGLPVHVVGSDLNTDSLGHARQGVYGEWSLRRTDQSLRRRHFEPTGRGRFRVDDSLRKAVHFERHNVLVPHQQPPTADHWDVVLCRNVLIYFSDQALRDVLAHFSESLHDNGYLLLGSSEQLHTGRLSDDLIPFRHARQSSGFVYRLRTTPPGHTVSFPPRESTEPEPDYDVAAATLDLDYYPSLDEDTSDVTSGATTHQAANDLMHTAAEHLANGRTDAALACCEATASYDPFVPENYCLMAYILSHEGAQTQAVETYRKALFLEPLNWIAAVETARLQMRRGQSVQAKLAMRQALEGLEANRRLPEDMRRVVDVMSRALTEPAAAQTYCQQYLRRLRGEKFLD